MATLSLRDESTDLLQRLIRLDTVNPPGNETAAAELLRDYLDESGVVCELYAKVPERANLVARIPGRSGGPRLLLLSHTDTVLADAGEWQLDPWSGALRDGEIWGRGALDMKGQVAANAVAIASLAREGFEPAGDLQLTRRWATILAFPGSAVSTPTRSARITASTKGRATGSISAAGACSTSARPRRR
jgi:acetylornithine deacetylase/succinyl-diaminopimelate desuccinylase-like protein